MAITLKIGRTAHEVTDLEAAVALHNKMRDESGAGSRDWPHCFVTGPHGTYYVSYNGRVWDRKKAVVSCEVAAATKEILVGRAA